MPEYDKKFEAAANELSKAGFWNSNAIPPYVRFVRKLGLSPKPPHYVSFWRVVLGMGLWFGCVWGLLMYSVLWRSQEMPIWLSVLFAIFAGMIFGLSMAAYFRGGATEAWLDDMGRSLTS